MSMLNIIYGVDYLMQRRLKIEDDEGDMECSLNRRIIRVMLMSIS